VIVSDANVVASYVLKSVESSLVFELLAADPHWVSPPLLLSELRSVLARQVRARRLGLDDAQRAFDLAMDTLDDVTLEPDTGRVMQLAAESGCSTYDCEYVTVAAQLGCPLATFDRQLLRAFPQIAAHPKRLLEAKA